jgi:hypothetical protein
MSLTPGNELKFGRAQRHFKEVQELLAAYKVLDPYEIRREENPDTGLSFWITLTKAPPDDIALAAGDCAHNLRSALDHIIYELSCHTTKKSHVAGTAFPIFSDTKNWDSRDAKAGDFKTSSGRYKLRAVPEPAVERIELLQPYNGSDPMYWPRDPLLELHQLDIADKHRNLNLAVANVPEIGVAYGHDGPQLKVIHVHKGRLNEGAETLLLRFGPAVDPKVNVQPYTFLQVVFADRPVEDLEVGPALQYLVVGVAQVLMEMRAFF